MLYWVLIKVAGSVSWREVTKLANIILNGLGNFCLKVACGQLQRKLNNICFIISTRWMEVVQFLFVFNGGLGYLETVKHWDVIRGRECRSRKHNGWTPCSYQKWAFLDYSSCWCYNTRCRLKYVYGIMQPL